MSHRAYSLLEIKAVDEDEYVIEGVATTPTPDRYNDIVEPLGAKFALPLPLLWQHNSREPVGEVEFAKPKKDGIPFRARIRKPSEFTSETLRERALVAWESVKTKLVRGVSIGFKPLERTFMDNGGIHFLKWEWLELSLVTMPANTDATITSIKSADRALRAASGPDRITPPGASGTSITKNPKPRSGTMTIKERIAAFEARRAAHQARMQEITEAAGDRGETKNAEEQEEFDTLRDEMKAIDRELVDLREMDTLNASAAKPVEQKPTVKAASDSRGKPVQVSTKPNRAKGIGFARYAMALAASKGNRHEAAMLAKDAWGDGADDVVAMLRRPKMTEKTAVAPGDTTTSTWASQLFEPTNLVNEFLEMLRPATLIGRIPGLRTVPFNVKVPSQTGGGTYAWVGESQPKPMTKPAFGQAELGVAKAAGIIVLTEELVRFSNPSAEALVRDEMIKGIGAFLDDSFIDPSVGAVSGVSPASITNGVTGTGASGTGEDDARADLNALLTALAADNYPLGEVVLITSESIAFALGGLKNPLGQPSFPGLTVNGGDIRGVPVITSNSVGAQIVAVHTPSILIADEGGVEIDVSREASIQMNDAPDSFESVDGNTVLVSLWQMNLVGLRAERFINWKKARTDAVDRIHTVAYVG
jgi:HK97 family phage major capsid protein/HK97 family phage prohead protease